MNKPKPTHPWKRPWAPKSAAPYLPPVPRIPAHSRMGLSKP